MIRTVIFDLYGTLADIRTDEGKPELWEKMAEAYRSLGAEYSPEELKSGYFGLVRALEGESLRHDDHEAHPEIRIEEVFAKLLSDRGGDPGRAVYAGGLFRELSTEYIRLYPGAKELLAALRGAGKQVILLSNAQRIFTAPELERLGIAGYFDAVYISSDYGVKKPDRRFFEICLNERNIEPKTSVMVGNDVACDIAGARSVGLKTIYVRSNISPQEPTPEADWVLEEMDLERVRRILLP